MNLSPGSDPRPPRSPGCPIEAPPPLATARRYPGGERFPHPRHRQRGGHSHHPILLQGDLEKQSCGAALDIRIFPDTLRGENGIAALKALLRGFVQLNGCFMQLDTVDAQTLREAQRDPETYKTLSVRVSGWNARFITLEKEWQSMIIERTAQGL